MTDFAPAQPLENILPRILATSIAYLNAVLLPLSVPDSKKRSQAVTAEDPAQASLLPRALASRLAQMCMQAAARRAVTVTSAVYAYLRS